MHLPSTFAAWHAPADNPNVRMGMLGEFGLTWPWESLHQEALAWYDHWLKGLDTGIMDGPAIRYLLPGTEEWHTADEWPAADSTHRELALCADGTLSEDERVPGTREYLALGAGLDRVKESAIDPPTLLTWTSAPMDSATDTVGTVELRLVAAATAVDTAWIATLLDVAPDGSADPITAGWLRASMRDVDAAASLPGAPALPCRTAEVVPVGEEVTFRIPLVPNARRIHADHRVRMVLTSDDQDPQAPVIMNFRHASVGTSRMNTVRSSLRLLLSDSRLGNTVLRPFAERSIRAELKLRAGYRVVPREQISYDPVNRLPN